MSSESNKIFPIAFMWWILQILGFNEHHYIIFQDGTPSGCTKDENYNIMVGRQTITQSPLDMCPFCNPNGYMDYYNG